MILTCPKCATRFSVDAEIPEGRRVKCDSCGEVWTPRPAAPPAMDPPVAEPIPEAAPIVDPIPAEADVPLAARPFPELGSNDSPLFSASRPLRPQVRSNGPLLLVLILLVVIVILALVFHRQVVAAAPWLEPLYAALGLTGRAGRP